MWPRFFTLTDGTGVVVRPIRPDDKDRLAEGLRRLSAETIRKRFLAAKPQFSSAELRYLTEVDGRNHIALVAALAHRPDRIVAVARSVKLCDRTNTAEMAIVVADRLQGQGLGRALGRMLADEAMAAGITHFAATMLSDNEPVQRLIASITRRFVEERSSGGVREVVGELARAA